jgi:hypothetical protein
MNDDELREGEAVPMELPPGEPESATDQIIQKTPWWSISTGIHVVFALLCAYLVVLGKPASDDEAVVVAASRKPRPVPQMDRPLEVPHREKVFDHKKAAEDVAFIKDAEESDRHETPDEQDFKSAKGDSPDMLSNKPFKGPMTYDTMGAGGGGGGYKGRDKGGRKLRVPKGGGDGTTEDAVMAALKWLSRHQNADGSWSSTYSKNCGRKFAGTCTPERGEEDYDMGVTGLSLLAFLGAGYSHLSKDVEDGICFGDVVRRGMQYLMSHQDPEGCIGARQGHYMYNHTICALAMSEAYGLTGSNLFKEQAQRSIDFVIAAQNIGKGWRYSAKVGDNDTSVTGWAVMALKSAELSGLTFPRSGYDGARAWLDEVTEENYYRVGYTHKGTGKVYETGKNENFNHHEALTAIAVMSRIFMDKNKADPRLSGGCLLLVKDLPKWDGNDIDFYYWYYASLALFQYDAPGGTHWKQWNERMKDALVKNQCVGKDGCKNGSWEPVDRWSHAGGRVYATAINALTLEVYYRYANVFGNR